MTGMVRNSWEAGGLNNYWQRKGILKTFPNHEHKWEKRRHMKRLKNHYSFLDFNNHQIPVQFYLTLSLVNHLFPHLKTIPPCFAS